MYAKKLPALVSLIFLLTFFSAGANAKSVYAIIDHGWRVEPPYPPAKIGTYGTDGEQIDLQKSITLDPNDYPTGEYRGPVGMAIDPESGYIFVTHERGQNGGIAGIQLINAKTMRDEGVIEVPGKPDLAGIVFDNKRRKVYTVERCTNKLFVLSWDAPTKTLTLEGGEPKTLAGIGDRACGLALDEIDDILYVTSINNNHSAVSNVVRYYDANDPNWTHKGNIEIVVDNNIRYAVGIGAYNDGQGTKYLYTGAYGSHYYLVRTDINDINNPLSTENYIGTGAIGIAVDDDTGLVYITTSNNHIEIYNPSAWPCDPCCIEDANIYGPAGICVPTGDFSYKPPFPLVELIKDDNDVNCASPLISEEEHELLGTPYNWLYYNIDCNANGHADTNVIITDYLPAEVNYISSDHNGVYDPNWHTVTWNIGDISASYSNTFRIQVGVNYHARPGETITNYCEIESYQYCTFTTWPTDICCYGDNIIYVNKDASGFDNGTSWLDAYEDLEDSFLGFRNCDCSQIWVAKGTYRPNDLLGRESSIELFEDVALYGGFPNTGDPNWSDRDWHTHITTLSGDIGTPNNLSDNSYHVVKCEDVNNAILDGFKITAGNASGIVPECYGGGIYCKDSNNLIIRFCRIRDNFAYCGGGMYNKNSYANLINSVFNDNSSTGYGCGMYNDQSSPTLINCIFTANTSTSDESRGGGMYNDQSSPTIINCTFSGNSVSMAYHGWGGAMCNTNSSEPNVTNCTFSNNYAWDGGAVYNVESDPNMTNCVFTDNNAIDYGGAIYSSASNPNITYSIFIGNDFNSAGLRYGGAMYNHDCSSATVTNCIFSKNNSNHGGGISNDNTDPNIINCIFAGNKANTDGGGVYSESSETNIINCIFTGNTAVSYGGGMANYDNSSLVLTNCTFSGNWAHYGGGIFSLNYADANLTNCIFWNNIAGTNCNEIYNDASSAVNVTYSDVEGGWSGTGMGNIDKDPCFYSVEDSSGSWTENATYDSSSFQSTLTDENADWAVNELAGKFVNPYIDLYDCLQFFIVSNNVNTIKVWGDVTAIAKATKTYQIYDYHLRVDSPCVDAGDPDYNTDPNMKDIDGEPRVFDGDANGTAIVDMGADEYYWSPADINGDGLVNFFDYAFFASAWQSEPNDPNYNEDCDLEDNNLIDYKDIALFCEDWLWQTAWAKAFPFAYETMGRSMGKSMGEGLGFSQEFFPSASAKQEQPELTAADIEEIIKWLEDLWLTNEEVRKIISEDDWLKFIEQVLELAKQEI